MNKSIQVRFNADMISFEDVLIQHINGTMLNKNANNYKQNVIDLIITYDDRNQYIKHIVSDTSCRNEYGSIWPNYDETIWSLSSLEWANKLGLQDLVDSTNIFIDTLTECDFWDGDETEYSDDLYVPEPEYSDGDYDDIEYSDEDIDHSYDDIEYSDEDIESTYELYFEL